MIDTKKIREQFPILTQKVNGAPLIYFDNGATTQKPLRVIENISEFYKTTNSNIHRGVHTLSRLATDQFEQARKTIASHFHVKNDQQVIFTAGTTDSINIVAESLAKKHLQNGDEIILSTYEHHSNILPWQLWAQANEGTLKVIPLKENQSLDYEAFEKLLSPKTKLIALAHVSNTLGLISDLEKIKAAAAKFHVPILIDGAQSAPHMTVDLQKLDVDFYTCSAHKIYGPTGVGILYLSEKWLRDLPVARSGGGTIKTVSFEKTVYAEGALRYEPGTPNISGAIAFAEAIKFVDEIGMQTIFEHEEELVQHAQKQLKQIPEVVIYGENDHKAGVISFNIKGQHPFDVGTLLDKYGIAVRTGHHCTQPLMNVLGIQGTVRISFAVYNTKEEIDFFIEKLKKVITMLN
ncbi:aminotransferase class V-fold PLP-dependent enzyme [Aurantibacillus circumpalustris]|uniref:aminotransferase class V-fold PLP-dependent enzyme n=1 Tax=Aurantibacillus circumpalustris TaxID=3036359 RepID=UPI00295BB711|nr:cysteine desulfurase [Aurantibacillus circumpalustris]